LSVAAPDVRLLAALDVRLLRAARTVGHHARAERWVARFSRLGEHGMVWLVLAGVGAFLDPLGGRRWRRAAATISGAYALNTLLKLVVRRPRPQLPDLPALVTTPTQLSFPSSHATTSFAAAGLYWRLGLSRPGLYALAVALSGSRLYLGVHYPSDVLAGAAAGHVVARVGRRWSLS